MLFNLTVRFQTFVTHYLSTRVEARGVTMLEYVLMGLMVVAVGMILWRVFGQPLQNAFTSLGNAISS